MLNENNKMNLYPSPSVLQTIKEATTLFLKNWKALLILVAVYFMFFLFFIGTAAFFPEAYSSIYGEYSESDISIIGFSLLWVAIILLGCVALILIGYYDGKLSNSHISIKKLFIKSTKKIIPIFLGFTLIFLMFLFFLLIATGLFLLLFHVSFKLIPEDYFVRYILFIPGSLLITILSGFLLSRIYNCMLFAQAMMLDDKSILSSVKYSIILCGGWRSSWKNFLLMCTIFFIGPIIQTIIYLLSTGTEDIKDVLIWAYTDSWPVIDIFLFPWQQACLVCWYRKLQRLYSEQKVKPKE